MKRIRKLWMKGRDHVDSAVVQRIIAEITSRSKWSAEGTSVNGAKRQTWTGYTESGRSMRLTCQDQAMVTWPKWDLVSPGWELESDFGEKGSLVFATSLGCLGVRQAEVEFIDGTRGNVWFYFCMEHKGDVHNVHLEGHFKTYRVVPE